jgi:GH24 family phage-related lysozyme (muramidase)
MNDTLNKSLIEEHEGTRLVAYRDTRGFLTIGTGSNLDAIGASAICARAGVDYFTVRAGAAITAAQADFMFTEQYNVTAAQARHIFPAIDGYPDNAAAVICDMLFELGLGGFCLFKKTIAAFWAKDYPAVIAGIEDSMLETQVPGRVADNVRLLKAIPPTT